MTRAAFMIEIYDHGAAAGVYRYEAYLCLPDIDGVQAKAAAASPWLAVRAVAEQAGRQERHLQWVKTDCDSTRITGTLLGTEGTL